MNRNSWMQHAIDCAHEAASQDEVPIGAVVVHHNKIIAHSGNAVYKTHDPTAHAEIIALRQAAHFLKTSQLIDCDLYVTLEPCMMCVGAIAWARIRRLYFGAYDPKGGAVEHGARYFNQVTCHHRPEIIGGILENKCAALVQNYFKLRR